MRKLAKAIAAAAVVGVVSLPMSVQAWSGPWSNNDGWGGDRYGDNDWDWGPFDGWSDGDMDMSFSARGRGRGNGSGSGRNRYRGRHYDYPYGGGYAPWGRSYPRRSYSDRYYDDYYGAPWDEAPPPRRKRPSKEKPESAGE